MKYKILVMLLCMLAFPAIAHAEPQAAETQISEPQATEEPSISLLEEAQRMLADTVLPEVPLDAQQVLGNTLRNLANGALAGALELDSESIMRVLGNVLVQSFKQQGVLLAQLLILSALAGLIEPLQSSFSGKVAEVCRFVIYMVAMSLILWDLRGYLTVAQTAMNQMVQFVSGVFPVLVTLVTALGGVASAPVFQPALLMVAGLVTNVFGGVLLPLILVGSVMTILHHLSDRIRLKQATGLIKSVSGWVIGGTCTLYLGVLTLKGVVAAGYDGLTMRTAKYAIGAFVPVVGGMFSDSVDVLMGCSLLVKNAVGIAGLASLAAVCLLPAMRILSGMLLYRLAAALAEPLGDKSISKALTDLSGMLMLLFVTVVSVGLMLFLTVTLLIGSSNLQVSLR